MFGVPGDGQQREEIREIIRALEAQGWRVDGGGKHYKAFPSDNTRAIVTFSKTPSDSRWKQNLLAQLRRSGYRD